MGSIPCGASCFASSPSAIRRRVEGPAHRADGRVSRGIPSPQYRLSCSGTDAAVSFGCGCKGVLASAPVEDTATSAPGRTRCLGTDNRRRDGNSGPRRSRPGSAAHQRIRCPKPRCLPTHPSSSSRRCHGCSTLYYLAEAGVSDVILLERNRLTSGTTWHSAAQVRALRSTRNLTDLIRYSVSLYSKLKEETGQATGWINKGRSRSPRPRTGSSISGARRRWRICSACAPGRYRWRRRRSAAVDERGGRHRRRLVAR